MALYGAQLTAGDDTIETLGFIAGLYLMTLFAVHVTCRLHLYPPVCARCDKLADTALRVVDYFPLRRQAILEFGNEEYAQAFKRANPQSLNEFASEAGE